MDDWDLAAQRRREGGRRGSAPVEIADSELPGIVSWHTRSAGAPASESDSESGESSDAKKSAPARKRRQLARSRTYASAMDTVEEEPTSPAAADETDSRKSLHRAKSFEWLTAAAAEHPYLLPSEIEALRLMFDSFASSSAGGTDVITVAGMQTMLDAGLKELFGNVDKDSSGELDKTEVGWMIQSLGKPVTETELEAVMTSLDHDHSGTVDFAEFQKWWEEEEYASEQDRSKELEDLFSLVDTDGSGEIDWEEFLEMIGSQLRREDKDMRQRDWVRQSGQDKDTGERVSRDPATLLRVALECMRADVRAIYGSMARPRSRVFLLTESELTARKRQCFFRPEGHGAAVTFRKTWDISQIFMLFYVATALPFRLGFSQEVEVGSLAFWWEVLVDIYFVTDIVINFRTAFYDDTPDRDIVVDYRRIAFRYLKGWFVVDLLSCLPVSYIELAMDTAGQDEEGGAGAQMKLFKIFRMLRLAKLLRLARIRRVMQRLEDMYPELAQSNRVMKIIVSILVVAHFVACAWYFVGSGDPEVLGINEHGEQVIAEPWVTRQFGGTGESITNGTGISLWDRYLDAMYYSVTTLTTVGYGDRVPHTANEKVCSILFELAGTVIFGIIAGSLAKLAVQESLSHAEISKKRRQLEEFMHGRVPVEMQKAMVLQCENWFTKKSAFDEETMLQSLPPKHRKELLTTMYKPYLVQSPLLQGVEAGVITKLCVLMHPYLAVANDDIVLEGEVGEEMYMIMKGAVRLTSVRPAPTSAPVCDFEPDQCADLRKSFRRTTLGRGKMGAWISASKASAFGLVVLTLAVRLGSAFFGELTVLLDSRDGLRTDEKKRHVYTANAIVDSDCMFINESDLDQLDRTRPGLKSSMRIFALKRAQRELFNPLSVRPSEC